MIVEKLQHQYALSRRGARDMMWACASCTLSNWVLMMPVGLLFWLVADLLQGPLRPERAWLYAAGTAGCLLLIAASYAWQYKKTFYATYIESGVRRIAVAERLRRLPLSFFGKKDLADLTSTIMSDCASIETASSHFIPEFYGSIASTLLVAVPLFFFDWRLALGSLWPLPVSLAVVALSPHVIDRLERRQMGAKMALADGIQECLEALRELKTSNAEADYLRGLDLKIKAVERRAQVSELGGALFVVPAQMVLKVGIATTAIVGGGLLAAGNVTVLTFFMFMLVISRLYDPMGGALVNLAAILMLRVRTERMNGILEHPVQEGRDELTNQGCDIRFDHVSFGYDAGAQGREDVLHDVTFTARQGEVTALIGPSGGGKTTVSRLAARFWDCTDGRVCIGGMDVSQTDPERLLTLFSIVFQDVTLFNNTVMENIRIGRRDATDEEVMAAARMAHCDEMVERLPNGWQTLIGENGSELSGGERQRISIARAFLKDAPIILLDEPTSSLDVENEVLVQQAVARLIQDKTVLLIAHRMRTVAGADRIVVLQNGTVAQQGTPAELLAQGGFFKEMMEKQTCAEEIGNEN